MIYLKESETYKLPGATSWKVTFSYNEDIVSAMKTIPNAVYSKCQKTWEVPLTSTEFLIDTICAYDDIDISILPDDKEKEFTLYDLMPYKSTPYPYQIEGIQYGLNHDKFLLLDQPGLGKSMQSIYIAQERHRMGQVTHCLVICGVNTLKYNWKNEIEKHSDLSCRILGQRTNKRGRFVVDGVKKRIEQLLHPIKEFFVIVNIESLRSDELVKVLCAQKANKFEMCIFDEIHHAKSFSSQQGENLLKLDIFKYRIAMTGTLLLNNPIDCFVPLKWIGVERSTLTNFKYYFCNFSGQFNNILTGYKNLNILKEEIEKNSIRRTKEILKDMLPEKIIVNEYVDMNDEQTAFYNDLQDMVCDEADKLSDDAKNALSCLLSLANRLRQATACPSMLTTLPIKSSKIERCKDLVEEICSDNCSKVVVFTVYKETANALMNELKDFNPLLCTGDVPDSIIDKNIQKFQSNNYNKVMVCTEAKLGTGVTLTRANTVIFIDTPYTFAEYQQCQDRCHRIGSEVTVTIYNLICADTVDERVLEIVEDKEMLSNYIIDDIMPVGRLADKLRHLVSN